MELPVCSHDQQNNLQQTAKCIGMIALFSALHGHHIQVGHRNRMNHIKSAFTCQEKATFHCAADRNMHLTYTAAHQQHCYPCARCSTQTQHNASALSNHLMSQATSNQQRAMCTTAQQLCRTAQQICSTAKQMCSTEQHSSTAQSHSTCTA